MKNEKALKIIMEDSWRPDDPAEQGGPCPAPAGPSYSEAWGYFHLDSAQPRHLMSAWATCRLCGEQVGGLPSFQMWTRALWRHLSDAHLLELKKSAAPSSPPAALCRPPPPPPPPSPAMAAEGDWARLLDQMGALAMRGSRRELELERREAALKQAELALERKRWALQQQAQSLAQARSQLREEREALKEWMEQSSDASTDAQVSARSSPLPLLPKKDPDTHDDGDHQGPAVARQLHV